MCSGKFREDHADGGRCFVQREPAAAAKKTLLRRVPAHFLCAEVDGQSVSESGEGSGAAVREDGPVREILFAGQARHRQDVAGEIVGEIAALRVAAVFERPVPDVGKIVAAPGKHHGDVAGDPAEPVGARVDVPFYGNRAARVRAKHGGDVPVDLRQRGRILIRRDAAAVNAFPVERAAGDREADISVQIRSFGVGFLVEAQPPRPHTRRTCRR